MSRPHTDLVERLRPHLTEREAHLLGVVIRQLEHATVRNPNDVERERLTLGERWADAITALVGSWRFIITQAALLALWLIVNAIGWALRWDPYPFILLNLVLSFQAAFTAPIIMMSQNRQASRDRLEAELDFEVNRRAEHEVATIQSRLDDLSGRQWEELLRLQQEQLEILTRIEALSNEVRQRFPDPADGAPG